jgi:hypothetical protein
MYKRIAFFLFLIAIFFFSVKAQAHAFTLNDDPQYIVMNFSTINELNWAANENEWQTKIKPQVLEQIDELKKALPTGTKNRQLAWSTLQEYMNTPMDQPSADSYYGIKVRRILDVAEEENLPVFLPLNGFQWWDQLPELYNWWDADGTHTPDVFFKRLSAKTPDFKERFIKGYDPQNIWNVEWQDFSTPMNLNWRNWGGGGFRLAPPPNIDKNHQSKLSYREVQAARLQVILHEIAQRINRWQQTGKEHLFAGITIGTEVSLSASVTPKDEFTPYGYRAAQDEICGGSCSAEVKISGARLEAARQTAIASYLNDLTRMAVNAGIPKQKIYTHVWSEAQPGEPRYSPYAPAAFTLYSRAGLSLYGYSDKPFDLHDWKNAVFANGKQAWGAVEYSAPSGTAAWVRALHSVLDSPIVPAKIVTIYNWSENKNTPAIPGIAQVLETEPQQTQACNLPEIIPLTENYSFVPTQLAWKFLGQTPSQQSSLTLHIFHGIQVTNKQQSSDDLSEALRNANSTSAPLPPLDQGVYTWYLESSGCTDADVHNTPQRRFSEPRIMTISKPIKDDSWFPFLNKK